MNEGMLNDAPDYAQKLLTPEQIARLHTLEITVLESLFEIRAEREALYNVAEIFIKDKSQYKATCYGLIGTFFERAITAKTADSVQRNMSRVGNVLVLLRTKFPDIQDAPIYKQFEACQKTAQTFLDSRKQSEKIFQNTGCLNQDSLTLLTQFMKTLVKALEQAVAS